MRRAPHRWALGWLGAIAAGVALSACSLLTSLDGLTGGEADGGSEGATASSSGGTSSSGGGSSGGGGSGSGGASSSSGSATSDDAGSDGSASQEAGSIIHQPDAAPSPDAGIKDAATDSAPPRDSAPSPFCASLSPAPLFCDDFDQGALSTPWDQLSSTGGSESLSTASFVSAPYAMLVAVNPNASVTAIDVAGYKSLTAKQGVAGTATTSFDIRINAADESSNSDAILGAIQLWNGSAYWDVELEVFYAPATGDFIVSMSEDDPKTYVEHTVTPHLPLGAWTKVTLTIALPAGSGGATTATMAFNGTTVLSQTVHVSTSNPIPEILIGTTYATPTSGGWSVTYDNVVFDYK